MAAFIRYVVVGGSALALHLLVLQSLLSSRTCSPWQASAIGFVIACAFNYTLQRLWVFRSARAHRTALPLYMTITTVMLGVNTVLFSALYGAGLPPLLAQTMTTGCVFLLNFFGNRYITFGGRKPARAV